VETSNWISAGALLVAVVGTGLANRRATQAAKHSKGAEEIALWSGIQEAVHLLLGFDFTSEPLGDRLANLRIAMISLVDGLDWDGLDGWLEAERALGAAWGRQVLEASQPGDTVEMRLEILEPYMLWAQLLSSNLRYFRKVGHDADAIGKLQEAAETQSAKIYKDHGWTPPPTSMPGVQPLGETS
jgi:hypothetical protein